MNQDNLIRRAWRAEPVAIVTIVGTMTIAALEAMSSQGWSWTTVGIAAIGALMGLIERRSVFAPDTIETLGSQESKDDLTSDSSAPDVQA